ncbi:MAG: alcohol dehydrogenase catalytic domain-containing protein [Spirochaetaceae bacterium]|nr:MAG: alcohol dehydrogenase catalytic domain-containing protein [Spirochaetaceae bacterium]
MKAGVLTGPERIEIQEIDKPKIGDREVLIRLKFCGICTLEQRMYTGQMKFRYPVIPGHEASGVVEQIGEEVGTLREDLQPGARVALDLVSRCGECYYCRTGASNLCVNRYKNGERILGGFAEYSVVSSRQVFPISEALSLEAAAFAEPVACCIRSLKKIQLSLAEDLLIVGAGPMGMMHLMVGNCMGARIFVSDPDKERLKTASRLGAYVTVNPTREDLPAILRSHTEGRGVDACVVTSPAPVALESAFQGTAHNGRINIYTSYNEKLPLPTDANSIHRSEILVTGSEGRTEEDFLQAVRLLVFGKVDVTPLISRKVSFSGLEEGIKAAMTAATYRVLLDHEAE